MRSTVVWRRLLGQQPLRLKPLGQRLLVLFLAVALAAWPSQGALAAGLSVTASDVTISEDAGEQTVVLEISGVQAGGANVTMTAVSFDDTVIPHPASGSYVASDTIIYGNLYFTPVADAWTTEVLLGVTVKQTGATNGSTTIRVVIEPVADPVTVSPESPSTREDTTTSAITLSRNAVDGAEVGYFRFSAIIGGTLYQSDGVTPIANGDTLPIGSGGTMDVYFAPAAGQSGSAESFGFAVQGCTSAAGAGLGPATTVGVAVEPVNDAPVVTAPATVSTAEDTAIVFSESGGNAISIADVDAGSGAVSMSLSAAAGTLTLASTSGLTFTSGDGTADPQITCSGALADLNAALAGLTFAPQADYAGSASLTITANDGGNTGSDGPMEDEQTVAITVTAANDPPVITVPGAQTTNEDTVLVFSSTSGNGITVTDVDAGSGSLSLLLEATGGIVTGTGLTGSGTPSASLTGSLSAINTALHNLQFTPTANSHGAAQLVVTVNDNGNTGGSALEAQQSVAITVAPVADSPSVPAPTTAEDTLSANIVISRAAVDSTEVTHVRVLNYSGGMLYAADGVTPIAALSYLPLDAAGEATVRFRPAANYSGAASFQVRAALDSSGLGISPAATVNLTVTAVNDAPTVTVPSAQGTTEDTPLVFSAANGNLISVGDIDAGAAAVAVTLAATHGTLTLHGLSGLTFTAGDGTDDAAVAFSGMLSDVNTALNGMTFTPEAAYFGSDAQVSVTVNDQGNTGDGGPLEATANVAIAVSSQPDTPTTTTPSPLQEDTQGDAVTVHRNAADGPEASHIRVSGITNGQVFLGDGVTPVSEGGTVAISEPVGVALRFLPAPDLNDATSVFGFDVRACNSAACTVSSNAVHVALSVAPVNDPPTFTKGADRLVNATAGPQTIPGWATSVSPGPADEASQTVSFSLTATSPDLFAVQPALTSAGTLTYTPAADRRGSTVVTIESQDSLGLAGTVQTFVITVNALPAVSLPGSPWTYVEGHPAGIVDGAATVGDADGPDNLNSGRLTITLVSGGEGSDELSIGSGGDTGISTSGADVLYTTTSTVTIGTKTGGSGTTPMVVTLNANATLPAVEALLRSITFRSTSESPTAGDRTVRVQLTDGFTPNDGSTAGLPVDTTVSVQPVNDAPNVTVPGAQAVQENTPLPFSASTGNAVAVADADSGVCVLTLTATSQHGTVELGDSSGLTELLGDGTATVVASGTVAAINAALEGARFTPETDYRGGSAGVSFAINDNGCSGDGGSLTDADVVAIDVRPTADLPVIAPNPASTREDVALAGLVIARNPSDGDEVTHFKITALTAGQLFLADGVTPVPVASFVAVQDAGAGLVYVPPPEYSGTVTLRVRASVSALDSGLGPETAVATITVLPVNDQPSFTAGADQFVLEDADSQSIPGWATSITPGAANEASQTLTFWTVAANPALFAIQPTVLTSGELRYTPKENACGSTTVTVTLRDNGGTANGGIDTSVARTFTITIQPVAEAPGVTSASTTEDTQTVSGLVVTRNAVDGPEVTHFLVTDIQHGSLYLVDGVTQVPVGGFITVVQGAQGLRFTPDRDFSGTAGITVKGATAASVAAAGEESATATITVVAINDAPVNHLPASPSTPEDTPLVFSISAGNAITISDPDAAAGGLTVTLAAARGTLTLASTAGLTFGLGGGDGVADSFMEFTGVVSAVNAALDGLTFTPEANYNGAGASILVSANDGGRTGSGGVQYDVDTLPILITPVPERPLATRAQGIAEASNSTHVTLSRNPSDGEEVTHFLIDGIVGGSLRLADGATAIGNGAYITVAQGASGLTFVPADGYSGFASFSARSATSSLGSGPLSEALVVAVAIGNERDIALAPGAPASLNAQESAGALSLSLPAGSVDGAVTLAYVAMPAPNAVTPPGKQFAGRGFALAAIDQGGGMVAGYRLNRPMTVTLDYSDAAIDDIDESTLALFSWDGSTWSDAAATCDTPWQSLDEVENTLSLNVCQLGEFALLGDGLTAHRVYAPMTMANFHLFTNGGFDDGLSGWTVLRAGFGGHGTGLPVGTANQGGITSGILGQLVAQDGSIPVGYGALSQAIPISGRYLQIRYRVQTYDIVRSSAGYFDTFEVSLNVSPADITNAQRDAAGCASTILNPDGVVVPSGNGLAVCGGYAGTAADAGVLHDLGWRTVSLDLTGFSGNVTLYLAVWNRETAAPYYDDHGWYNTVAYVDYVRFSDTP